MRPTCCINFFCFAAKLSFCPVSPHPHHSFYCFAASTPQILVLMPCGKQSLNCETVQKIMHTTWKMEKGSLSLTSSPLLPTHLPLKNHIKTSLNSLQKSINSTTNSTNLTKPFQSPKPLPKNQFHQLFQITFNKKFKKYKNFKKLKKFKKFKKTQTFQKIKKNFPSLNFHFFL